MNPKRVYIDFESRSQADIWQTGAYRYAEDPTTEILCIAWAEDNGPISVVPHGVKLRAVVRDVFNDLIRSGAEFHAHNAFFERSIWRLKLTPGYGALPIPLTQWRCIAAKAAQCGLPRSLEQAAIALGCKYQKDMEGAKVMEMLATSKGIIDTKHLERLMEYCKRDVAAEREIDQKLPDLPPDEQKTWFLDQYINDNGVRVDIDAVRKAVKLIAEEKERLNKELFSLTGGQVEAGTQRDAIKRFLESKGVQLPDLTKQTVKSALASTSGDNFRILQLRQQISLTSNAKYAALDAAVSSDSRVRDTLVYHGAATGRWSGKLVQLQNLVKAELKPEVVNDAIETLKNSPTLFSLSYEVLPTLSSCIRGMLIPSPGYDMFTTDFSAIEARVVMWLAEETVGLTLFRQQDLDPTLPDIYVHMARAIHSREGITKENKKERQLGKQAVLGCGFGMGVDRFIITCQKYEVEVTPELASRAVTQYRNVFAKVPRLWDETEDAAKKTVSSGKPHQAKKIGFEMFGEFLRMALPSGRRLYYHRPKIMPDGRLTYLAVNPTTDKYVVEDTWGGKLVENATQATARDIMRDAMFRLTGANHRILFTVHDELVTEYPERRTSPEEVVAIVCSHPAWAKDCPINAESMKVRRYQK